MFPIADDVESKVIQLSFYWKFSDVGMTVLIGSNVPTRMTRFGLVDGSGGRSNGTRVRRGGFGGGRRKGFASGAYFSALFVAPLGAAISWKPVSEMGVRCCGSKLTSLSLFSLGFWVGSNIGKGLNSGVLAFALEKFLISPDNSG
jgi:hypothetical protein